MLKVLCLGGVTLDVLVSVADDTPDLPGQKQEVRHIELAAGGGAMNAASVFSRLGAEVGIHCAVGQDEAGEFIFRRLKEKRINAAYVEVFEDAPTGKSVITIPRSGDASVMAARGANQRLSARCISMNSADLLYITSAPRVACCAIADRLSNAARPFGFVAFNPGMSQIIEDIELCEHMIQASDLLMVNKSEALQLTRQMSLPFNGLPVSDICKNLSRMHEGFVCVTDGMQGAWLASGDKIFYQPSCKPLVKAHSYSTIGAGDTFGATLAYMLKIKKSPDLALQLAARNAASAISRLDAHSGALSIEELSI